MSLLKLFRPAGPVLREVRAVAFARSALFSAATPPTTTNVPSFAMASRSDVSSAVSAFATSARPLSALALATTTRAATTTTTTKTAVVAKHAAGSALRTSARGNTTRASAGGGLGGVLTRALNKIKEAYDADVAHHNSLISRARSCLNGGAGKGGDITLREVLYEGGSTTFLALIVYACFAMTSAMDDFAKLTELRKEYRKEYTSLTVEICKADFWTRQLDSSELREKLEREDSNCQAMLDILSGFDHRHRLALTVLFPYLELKHLSGANVSSLVGLTLAAGGERWITAYYHVSSVRWIRRGGAGAGGGGGG